MSEEQGNQQVDPALELKLLKDRANMMGVTYSNNIGVDALRKKIQDKIDGTEAEDEGVSEGSQEAAEGAPNALALGAAMTDREASDDPVKAPERKMTLREHLVEENMRLIRCRITNLDPKKKDLPGEILTTGNEYLGTVRKYVPYGEQTDEGYHIPHCLYTMMKDRKFLSITVTRDRRTGTMSTKARYVPEFSIEVMEPLTRHELNQLAQAQIAAGSVGESE